MGKNAFSMVYNCLSIRPAQYGTRIELSSEIQHKSKMKKFLKMAVGFVKREWFLITMITIIAVMITLFEVCKSCF